MSKFRAHRSMLAFSLMELIIALFVFSITITIAWNLTGLAYRTENYFDRVLSQRVNFENAMSLLRSDLSSSGKPINSRNSFFLQDKDTSQELFFKKYVISPITEQLSVAEIRWLFSAEGVTRSVATDAGFDELRLVKGEAKLSEMTQKAFGFRLRFLYSKVPIEVVVNLDYPK